MFKFRKPLCPLASPVPVSEELPVSSVNANGVEIVRFVTQPVSVGSADIPPCDEYKLSDLLAAGVPLNSVPTDILDQSPSDTQIEKFANTLDNNKLDNND